MNEGSQAHEKVGNCNGHGTSREEQKKCSAMMSGKCTGKMHARDGEYMKLLKQDIPVVRSTQLRRKNGAGKIASAASRQAATLRMQDRAAG